MHMLHVASIQVLLHTYILHVAILAELDDLNFVVALICIMCSHEKHKDEICSSIDRCTKLFECLF